MLAHPTLSSQAAWLFVFDAAVLASFMFRSIPVSALLLQIDVLLSHNLQMLSNVS